MWPGVGEGWGAEAGFEDGCRGRGGGGSWEEGPAERGLGSLYSLGAGVMVLPGAHPLGW